MSDKVPGLVSREQWLQIASHEWHLAQAMLEAVAEEGKNTSYSHESKLPLPTVGYETNLAVIQVHIELSKAAAAAADASYPEE